jgi:ABC-2 type transport system ATP-binding protein
METSQTPAISVQGLTKMFGDFTAVDHVSFEVMPGEILGYIGHNGSGKTTTIRMLCGLLTPTEGTAKILGYDIRTQTELIRPLIGYMSQKFSLYDDLTVAENVKFYAGVYDVPEEIKNERLEEVYSMAGLVGRTGERTGTLSGGWRQRLALGCAMVHHPKLLFLDEPTSGVDPVARREFWDLIYDLASRGTTILITTHYMDEAEHCSQIGFMNTGRLRAFDTPLGLKKHHLHGAAWSVEVTPLLEAVEYLSNLEGIAQARLQGDRAQAIVARGKWTHESLRAHLEEKGLKVGKIETVEPTLEDVFTLLAHVDRQNGLENSPN